MAAYHEAFECAGRPAGRLRRALVALLSSGALLAALALLVAAPAQAISPRTVIRFLNAQRRANGIPAVRDYQPFATSWCPNEDSPHWLPQENSRELAPSILTWSRTGSPWDDAPLHQQGQYNPAYTRAGAAASGGDTCLGSGDAATPPSRPAFYAYTSDRGPRAVPTSEAMPLEGPFSPEQVAGIHGGTTGPVLIVYALGFKGEQLMDPKPTMRVTSWTLKTGTGVRIRGVLMVDAGDLDAFDRHACDPCSTDGTAFLILPTLQPATRYDITVAWRSSAGMSRVQRFHFTTTPTPITETQRGPCPTGQLGGCSA